MGDLPDSLGRSPTVNPLSAMIPKVDPALHGNGENGIMREIEQGACCRSRLSQASRSAASRTASVISRQKSDKPFSEG